MRISQALARKDVINSVSQRALKRPVVEFVDSKVDPKTGERFLHSRWVAPEPPFCKKKVPLTHVSRRKGKVVVIVQLSKSHPLYFRLREDSPMPEREERSNPEKPNEQIRELQEERERALDQKRKELAHKERMRLLNEKVRRLKARISAEAKVPAPPE